MKPIRVQDGEFEVDAGFLAQHFRVEPADVPTLLRNGSIQTLCERGEGEDAGCYRLSFRFGLSRLALVVDTDGNLLRRTAIYWPKNYFSPERQDTGEANEAYVSLHDLTKP
jgi:hypothetical protein